MMMKYSMFGVLGYCIPDGLVLSAGVARAVHCFQQSRYILCHIRTCAASNDHCTLKWYQIKPAGEVSFAISLTTSFYGCAC